MIQTQLEVLRGLLGKLGEADSVRQKVRTLDSVQREVTDWLEAVPQAVAQFGVLARRALVNPADAPDTAKLLEALGEVRKNLGRSPLEVTSGKSYQALRRHVKKALEELNGTVGRAWGDWLAKHRPQISDEELAPYESWPEYRELLREIPKARAALDRDERAPPASDSEFLAVEGRIAALRAAIAKLPQNAPPEVKAFLDAANSRAGATLAQLTPAVIDWLRANGKIDLFRIRR
jgi:hypothetical protein